MTRQDADHALEPLADTRMRTAPSMCTNPNVSLDGYLSGRKMPAVKKLHQESDSNTKPEHIFGYSCQDVAILTQALIVALLSLPIMILRGGQMICGVPALTGAHGCNESMVNKLSGCSHSRCHGFQGVAAGELPK